MKKLLWVEDDNSVYKERAETLTEILPNLHIDAVACGIDAYDHMKNTKYDVIIADLRINWKPGVSNYDNYFGLKVVELSLIGKTQVIDTEYQISNIISRQNIWVLTGYDAMRVSAIALGVTKEKCILKGSESNCKFLERLIEELCEG